MSYQDTLARLKELREAGPTGVTKGPEGTHVGSVSFVTPESPRSRNEPTRRCRKCGAELTRNKENLCQYCREERSPEGATCDCGDGVLCNFHYEAQCLMVERCPSCYSTETKHREWGILKCFSCLSTVALRQSVRDYVAAKAHGTVYNPFCDPDMLGKRRAAND